MTEANHNRMAAEALVERIADGEATTADWAMFRSLANVEASLWQDLAEAQRTHAELCAQLNDAVVCADKIEAPLEAQLTEGLTRRIRVMTSWGGWAAAAAVLLAWNFGLVPGLGGNTAGPNLLGQPEGALQNYLKVGQQAGTVVGEMPTKLMVEVREGQGGRREMIFIRQIMERRVVPDTQFFRMGIDADSGQPRAVPADDMIKIRVTPN